MEKVLDQLEKFSPSLAAYFRTALDKPPTRSRVTHPQPFNTDVRQTIKQWDAPLRDEWEIEGDKQFYFEIIENEPSGIVEAWVLVDSEAGTYSGTAVATTEWVFQKAAAGRDKQPVS